MRPLGEIVEAARSGERPDYEELRYAVCALEALAVFAQNALLKLAEAERGARPCVLTGSAEWQVSEHFRRVSSAYARSPKEYLGWENDPDNPQYVSRRKSSKAIFDACLTKQQEGEK